MINHLLIFLALFSFSVVVHAAAIPMDSNQSALGATQNAVLHKEIDQTGIADKDVADSAAIKAVDVCQGNVACVGRVMTTSVPQSPCGWFTDRDSSSALQPLFALMLIITVLVVFLARKSISTK